MKIVFLKSISFGQHKARNLSDVGRRKRVKNNEITPEFEHFDEIIENESWLHEFTQNIGNISSNKQCHGKI